MDKKKFLLILVLIMCIILLLFWGALNQKQNYFEERCSNYYNVNDSCPCISHAITNSNPLAGINLSEIDKSISSP